MLTPSKFSRKIRLHKQTSIAYLIFLIVLLNVSAFQADTTSDESLSHQSSNPLSSSGMVKVGLTDIPEKENFSLEYFIKERAYLKLLEKDVLPYLKRKSGKAPTCFISYAWGDRYHEYWVKRFAEMLNKAGIQILLDRWVIKKGNILNEFVRKIEEVDRVLVVGTKLYLEKYNRRAVNPKEKEHVARLEGQLIEYLVRYSTERSNKVVPILLEGTPEESLPFMLRHKISCEFTKNDYFEELLKLIQDLYSIDNRDSYFEKIIEKFKKYATAAAANITEEEKKAYKKKQTEGLLASDQEISKNIDSYQDEAFKVIASLSLDPSLENEVTAVRSELVIPAEPSFLERSELIAEIDDKFKEQQGIQTIALVGIGGAGKTTLARQYARLQKDPVIWEINAETHGSLVRSFETLAYQIAITEKDYEELKKIKDINKNQEEKEERLIAYIKNKFKSFKSWFLVYDNVNKLSEIEKFLPNYPKIWGNGKIIITTRDINIRTNYHINHVLEIEELTQKECLDLFLKIMYKDNMKSITPAIEEQASSFVNNISPFPLDINAAAYYIKNTRTTYDNYLNLLKENERGFLHTQERILADASNYPRTRYSIIQLSLNNIINENPEFVELLLVTSLIDSQNIPRFLLERYKKSHLVDAYIYHLNRYSLITQESSSASSPYPTFSIHRSTQAVSLAYLTKILDLEKKPQFLKSVVKILEDYLVDLNNRDEVLKLKFLVTHFEILLSHHNLLTDNIRGSLESDLGCIYSSLGFYTKGNQLLEKALSKIKKEPKENYNKIAQNLACQGNSYVMMGEYEKAKILLEESLLIYKKYIPKQQLGMALALVYLGNVYKWKGEYKKAQHALEESLSIYNKYIHQPHMGKVMALAYLGYVHRELGNYKRAIDLLEDSIAFCQKYFSKDNIRLAWGWSYLGHVHCDLGNYEKARDFYEKGLVIYKKYFSEDHVQTASGFMVLGIALSNLGNYKQAKNLFRKAIMVFGKSPHIFGVTAYIHLGILYGKLGQYDKAKSLLQNSLLIYEKHYGKDHFKLARVLRSLGCVYLLEGNIEQAESLIMKALEISQQNNHLEAYASLEDLAELYLKQSNFAKNQGNIPLSEKFKQQAQSYVQQALGILRTHFPEDSTHISRLTLKLKKLD